jgi:DNA-binding CsgD family transcriptional regulator
MSQLRKIVSHSLSACGEFSTLSLAGSQVRADNRHTALRQLPECVGMPARVPSAFLSSAAWSAIGASLKLSARELQIVTCIVEDLAETQDDVGRHLGMSPHTVHTHLERLYKKLGVANRSHLIVRVFAEYVHLETIAAKLR